MKVKEMSTDKIIETLYWIEGRQRYRRACKIHDGAAYAEECRAEDEALRELQTRGVYEW